MLTAALTGFLLGLAVAAQVGPVSLMAVRGVLLGGVRTGVAVGAAAALVDTAYGALGLLGVSRLLTREPAATVAGLLGALVLVALGVQAARSARQRLPEPRSAPTSRGGAVTTARAFATALAATAANPLTIVAWTSAFAASGAAGLHEPTAAAALLAGIAAGTLTWFTALSLATHLLGRRATDRAHGRLDLVAGLGLVGFGLLLAVRTLG